MGSATRGALATARGVLDAEKATLATGEQLLAAARALASSTQLRSVIADPGITAGDKASLITQVFPGSDKTAATVLASVSGLRWSNPNQLVDSVEELGIRALAATAAGLEDELFEIDRAVSSDAELEFALGGTFGDPRAKAQLVERLLAKKASPATIAIVAHLVQSPRERRIGELLAFAARTVADASGGLVATVTAAAPLTPAQQKKLVAQLTAKHGREPRLDVRIDPAVIGGLKVQVGDEIVDGTIATRLADLRLQLAG